MPSRASSFTARSAAIALCFLAAACDGETPGPVDPTDADPIPTSIAPDPDGVLLPGDPARPALDGVVDMPQSPAPAAERDGLYLTSRLEAWIAPGATIGEVNAALEAHDARVLSMMPGVPLVTVVIPAVTDAEALQRRAETLQTSPAFLMVLPAMTTRAPLATRAPEWSGAPEPSGVPERVTPQNDTVPGHLEAARSPAAWNARSAALAVGARAPVLVADFFSALTPHPEVAAMSFPTGTTGTASAGANHGWHVTGTIAADFGGNDAVGIHPEATTLLDLQALPMGGLSWSGMVQEILRRMPASGNFVVSTSLGFGVDTLVHDVNGGNWTAQQLMTGIQQAIAWRIAVADRADRFLHATAAGNERTYTGTMNRADLGSPWTIAHRFDDPRDALPAGLLSTAQQQTVDSLWAATLVGNPEATTRLPNTIIVGSSDAFGTESSFSNADPTLRAVGENVFNVCRAAGGGCDGTYETMSGTSMATPQVAGMAAWLWNLRPEWSSAQVRERLIAADRGGVTDHYVLTLATDADFSAAPVRRAILDVAGSSTAPGTNGRFDENDIELYLSFFDTFEQLRETDFRTDHSRYDLNGDGYTDASSGSSPAPMDLDFDRLRIGTASYVADGDTISVNEGFPTDLEVLCYYAYSTLYDGDSSARDGLLTDCYDSRLSIVVEAWRDEVSAGATDTLTIRVLNGSEPAADVDVYVEALGGNAQPATGVTDADGRFTSELSFEFESDSMAVRISVDPGSSEPVEARLTAVTTGPGVIQAGSMGVTVAASSRARARYDIQRDSPPNITFSGEPVANFSATRVTSADTANVWGSADVSSSVELEVVVVESGAGATTGYDIDGIVRAATAITGEAEASASNELSFFLEFYVVGDSVPYTFESTFDPGGDDRGWTRFLGPFSESFDEREAPPGAPVSRTFGGKLGPGAYSIEFNFDRDVASTSLSPDPVSDSASVNIAVRFGEAAGVQRTSSLAQPTVQPTRRTARGASSSGPSR